MKIKTESPNRLASKGGFAEKSFRGVSEITDEVLPYRYCFATAPIESR